MRARPWARLPVSSATLERLLRSHPGRRGPAQLWRRASERLSRSVKRRPWRSVERRRRSSSARLGRARLGPRLRALGPCQLDRFSWTPSCGPLLGPRLGPLGRCCRLFCGRWTTSCGPRLGPRLRPRLVDSTTAGRSPGVFVRAKGRRRPIPSGWPRGSRSRHGAA